MRLSNKYGVEIDHCPQCRGVWLNRGELEKVANIQNQYEDNYYQKYHQGKDHEEDDDYYYHRIYHKEKSFFGDMFDFDWTVSGYLVL